MGPTEEVLTFIQSPRQNICNECCVWRTRPSYVRCANRRKWRQFAWWKEKFLDTVFKINKYL